jgi:hypothetical protein
MLILFIAIMLMSFNTAYAVEKAERITDSAMKMCVLGQVSTFDRRCFKGYEL